MSTLNAVEQLIKNECATLNFLLRAPEQDTSRLGNFFKRTNQKSLETVIHDIDTSLHYAFTMYQQARTQKLHSDLATIFTQLIALPHLANLTQEQQWNEIRSALVKHYSDHYLNAKSKTPP